MSPLSTKNHSQRWRGWGGSQGVKGSKMLFLGDATLRITPVNYTVCYLWDTMLLASQSINEMANRFIVSVHLIMWSWHEWNILFSLFKILSVCQGSVQITYPFWSFPWLNKSTKHSTGAREWERERPTVFSTASGPLGTWQDLLFHIAAFRAEPFGKMLPNRKHLRQFGSSFWACP